MCVGGVRNDLFENRFKLKSLGYNFCMSVKSKQHTFTVLIEQDQDGYYVASVPSLKSCYTQAKSLTALYPRIKEVIELCLEEQKPVQSRFVALQQVQV